MSAKTVALGRSDFPKLIAEDVLYIDKSLFIKEIIDDKSEVILITRPRRFGKTLNMSMLQHFFAADVGGIPTQGLFDGLQITQVDNGKYMQYQGQSPVIFLSFKEVVGDTLEEIKSNIFEDIELLFGEYHHLIIKNDQLNAKLKRDFEAIMAGTANASQYQKALFILIRCLRIIYGKKVYLLIDEYDTPLNHAFGKSFFKNPENFAALVSFVRNFLSAGLKDNPDLEKSVVTGVFRIAKANIFSGLNNIKEHTILDDKYASYFGFTEQEIMALAKPTAQGISYLNIDLAIIKEWYNGYNIGGLTIYNPWSILSYIQSQKIQDYWVATGSSQFIYDVLRNASYDITSTLERLIQGQTIKLKLNRFITFNNLATNEAAFWGMLLHGGYLTLQRQITSFLAESLTCEFRIPNQEVISFYLDILGSWLEDIVGNLGKKENFITALIAGNVEKFTEDLENFLVSSFSFFDVGGDNPERVYHAFMLGLMAHLQKIYTIKSNQESGYGRYDVLLKPKDKTGLAIIFEFKSIAVASSQEALTQSACEALEQIAVKQYANELDQEGIIQRLLIGVTFAGKRVAIQYAKQVTADFNSAKHITSYQQRELY